MKRFSILIIIAAALSAASCQKSFDVVDSGYLSGSQATDMVTNDPEFLNTYIQGLYTYMVEFGNYNYSGHDNFGFLSCIMITDFMGQDIVFAGTENWGAFDYQFDYGMADYIRPYQMWANYYTLINNANEIINFFQAGQDPTDVNSRGYLGQAYAMRAMCYTYLVQLFQDPLTEDSTPENLVLNLDGLTVPISYAERDGVDEATKLDHSGRNTLSTVMSHIEYNIEQSLKLLDGYTRKAKNEIDLSVAQGIAARYYLLTQQWEKAAEVAKAARQGYTIMDQTRLHEGFMEINDATVMWGFNHTTETQTTYASFSSHMSNECEGYSGLAQPVKCIDKNLYDQIPSSDYRKDLFNGPDGDPNAETRGGTWAYAARKFGFMDQWLQDYIYMRSEEMYLIEAEAYARQGLTAEATTVMTELMAQRDPQWNGGVSVEDILLQRRIELWGEGFQFYDLRRNAKPCIRVYDDSNHATWAYFDVPAHHSRWMFQIPTSEIDQNPELAKDPQNPLEEL